MRPPEFTGGKPDFTGRDPLPYLRFNEAAGIHRRKRRDRRRRRRRYGTPASMRPPGIHRRKPRGPDGAAAPRGGLQ